ncbi:Protein DMR6-LIKE OXYGENASE 1, partial [Linum perenne]
MVQTLDHEEIPTIDYFSLFSPNPINRSNALACLSTACEDYGFFNLVNHGIPERVMEGSLRGIGEFFERTDVKEKSKYRKGDPKARILWDARCHAGIDGGLQILTSQGKWVNVHIPPNAILIQLGDQLEVLTNGKYKSHVHRVLVGDYKVRRISISIFHGPSIETYVTPAQVEEAMDEEIPTIDYFSLFSPDLITRSDALARLSIACEDYGFFNLVNHGIPNRVMEAALSGIGEFFEHIGVEEKSKYRKGDPKARILWDARCHTGQHESYIETTLDLESGFDVAAMNRYPPNFESKGTMGLAEHTDPGFIISLIQDMDGGLQILTHQGKWVNVHIPPYAILIQLGDQLEVLTNGKYKSHVHRVLVDKYKARRVSLGTLHGPSIDKFVAPAPEFVEKTRGLNYRGMTYSESLEANSRYEIEVQSCIEQLRVCVQS